MKRNRDPTKKSPKLQSPWIGLFRIAEKHSPPPKTGAILLTVAMISSGSWVAKQMGKASIPANSLNNIAFPSITGRAASGPFSALFPLQ
jgi:hypothetical protein